MFVPTHLNNTISDTKSALQTKKKIEKSYHDSASEPCSGAGWSRFKKPK